MSFMYRCLRVSLDNDKIIGFRRFVSTYKNNDIQTQTYLSNAMQNKTNTQFNYNIHDAVIDTITSQTDDIKNIKLELIHVNAKLKLLLNSLNHNCNIKKTCRK
jgi:hypothetical protein